MVEMSQKATFGRSVLGTGLFDLISGEMAQVFLLRYVEEITCVGSVFCVATLAYDVGSSPRKALAVASLTISFRRGVGPSFSVSLFPFWGAWIDSSSPFFRNS